jgi:WhiB family transcriptional regulator, redox-sensing transcriptional regulator
VSRCEPGWVSLLAEILRNTPKLTGAACQGRHVLFDPPERGQQLDDSDVQYRFESALRICSDCCCLRECSDWVDWLPASKRPAGVVAGRLPESGRAAA